MEKQILLVDSDEKFLKAASTGLSRRKNGPAVETAVNGEQAEEKLKTGKISLVVTDLKVHAKGGVVFLKYVTEHHPFVPCIVTSAQTNPLLIKRVHDLGAIQLMKKPFKLQDLIDSINSALGDRPDGGVMHGVALTAFIPLVEMERKTCTIKIAGNTLDQRGSLFFREGVFLDASSGHLSGEEAAHKIFSWGKVDIAIQNSCSAKLKTINSPLQSILLEAVRLRDETKSKTIDAHETPIPTDEAAEAMKKSVGIIEEEDEAPKIEPFLRKMERALSNKRGVVDVFVDDSRASIVALGKEMGSFFKSGEMKLCSLSYQTGYEIILVPKKDTIAIKLASQSFKEDTINSVLKIIEI